MLPTFKVQNLGAAGAVPFTMGQVFAPGHVKPGQSLSVADFPIQVDAKATHPDGSLRHAVVSGVVPSMAAGEVGAFKFQLGAQRDHASVPKQGFDMARAVRVEITIAGIKWTATPDPAQVLNLWLQGPVVDEWQVAAPLRDAAGFEHSHLTIRVAARIYSAVPDQARMEVLVENCKTFATGAHFTYDVAIYCGDALMFSQAAIPHYHHARWRQTFWLDAARAPAAHVIQDVPYLIATKAIPNYDTAAKPSEKTIADWALKTTAKNTGPMKIGPIAAGMGMTGGRPEIGPLPGFTVGYLLSADMRMHATMTSVAEGAGSWSIHYRDETTGYPVRTDNEQNKTISTHMNMARTKPLPVPRFITGTPVSPYAHDTAHQPSMSFLPYLISGDYFHLEELHFWAAHNPLETAPGNNGYGAGLIRFQQLRGQAWSLRTLGHAAYITPDAHPLKAYFTKQLENNLDYFNESYVVANPNPLGMYDGSAPGAFPDTPGGITGSAPWQDDFQTWAFGYLADLGFEKAEPILHWRGKYIVARMTSPDFNWIHGADYYFKVRDQSYVPAKGATSTTAAQPAILESPLYQTIGEIYRATYGGPTIRNDHRQEIRHPDGLLYIDQPFDSPEMYAWLTAAHGRTWKVGRMFGYADSVEGHPANMQPALSVLVDHGVVGADKAQARYESRADKPDWTKGAQFNIVPRPVPVVEVEPPQPPAPNERCLVEAAIQRYAAAPDETAPEQRALAQEVFGLLLDSERARTIAQQSDKPQG